MEYTKETTDRFLNLYRQLETIRDFDQGLYSYYKKKYYEQFDEYRQIRNYLSHEEYGGGYPVAVSSLVCDDLERILCQMRKTCYDIATKKVVTYTYSDPLAKALNNFANHGVTYVPIVENKRVKGIVTAGKLLLILSKAKKKPPADALPALRGGYCKNDADGDCYQATVESPATVLSMVALSVTHSTDAESLPSA